jgi:hypothetical protein
LVPYWKMTVQRMRRRSLRPLPLGWLGSQPLRVCPARQCPCPGLAPAHACALRTLQLQRGLRPQQGSKREPHRTQSHRLTVREFPRNSIHASTAAGNRSEQGVDRRHSWLESCCGVRKLPLKCVAHVISACDRMNRRTPASRSKIIYQRPTSHRSELATCVLCL